jgi:hypothetical protein
MDKLEKLSVNDAFIMELLVDRINQIIDRIEEIDDRLTKRIDSHWKYHRFLSKRLEEVEDRLGITSKEQ